MAATVQVKLQEAKKWIDDKLEEKNPVTDVLKKFEKATGVKKAYIVYGSFGLIFLALLVGWGARILCNFIGFLYPAYASLKAIESDDKDDDTQWLTYWVVYSVFALTELMTDVFLFWVPFYWFFKCAFLMWCMAPASYNGSVLLYQKFIRPYVLRYEAQIDSAINQVKNTGEKLANEVKKTAKNEKNK